ncbi:MAG: hypothetical protein HQK55_10920, partial [Deltaproteobacteria bacterium]|nr:hypothetical protein [Deltaproteobacteria bacterium]
MSNSNNGPVLDAEAQKLYALLGGIEETPAIVPNRYKAGLAEVLGEEEKKLDAIRSAMAEAVNQLALCLAEARYPEAKSTSNQKVTALVNTLTELSKAPNQDGRLWIRYRGAGAFNLDSETNRNDYVIWLGFVMLDLSTMQTIANRGRPELASWPGRLTRDFKTLESLKISTLSLQVSPWSAAEIERMLQSLQTLKRYYQVLTPGGQGRIPDRAAGPPAVVMDENRQPNPNLTLLAGLNNLKKEAIDSLVQKVLTMMKKPEAAAILDQYATVHEAVFAFKNLRAQLIQPPME